jgi:hypothetical protein
MNRKLRIASTLALAGLLSASLPFAASAGTPLLSGYGGPGAGEQAIVGSTLLGGARGGGSSGGSSNSGGSSGSSGVIGGSSSHSTSAGRSGAGTSRGRGSPGSSRPGRGHARPLHVAGPGAAGAHIYPSSPASSDSRLIGISSGDVFPIAGIVVALALVGVCTLRFVRLQP